MGNWDDYRFFLAVIRAGSVSGAAETLNINHTTVSRRISALEARLGFRLFDRMRTGYLPTAEATRLLPAAEQMEMNAHQLARLSSAQDARLSGTLAVTAPPALVHYLLMPIVARFKRLYPDINVHLDGTDKISNLVSREADVAIRVSNSPMETLVGKRLAANRSGVFATRSYLADRVLTERTATERDDLDWISVVGDEGHSRWQAQHFPRGREACKTDSKMSAIAAALAGLGVVELPELIGDAEPRLVRLEGIEFKPDKDIWIVYHRDLRQTARVNAFVTEVRRHFRKTGASAGMQ